MGGIIDLRDGADHEVLTSTGSEGLFGGSYLDGDPLATYLDDAEEPKFVLRNKKSGVRLEDGTERSTVEPDDSYQTLALVTDRRILFVAGQHGGDTSRAVPLMDVVEATADSGLRTSTLTVETLANELWTFPCRGDPTPVATFVEEAAQSWANAARLLDELEESLGFAQDELADGNHEAARTAIDGGEATIRRALARMSEVGPGAHATISERAEKLGEWLVDLEREVHAMAAASDHAGGQSHWQDGEYEEAAKHYESALQAYERALDIDGATPTDDALRSRMEGAAAERELLRVAPLVDADTSRRRAVALADPEEAAQEWERAHESYRELLGLEWAEPDRQFLADRDLIREQTVEIVDDAISDHYEAGRSWLSSGDKLSVQGRTQQAEQVYERAKEQFERAATLATELRPDRAAEMERGIDAATNRLDGAAPTERVPGDPVAFEPGDEGADAATVGSREDADADDGIEDLSFHDSETDATALGGRGHAAGTSHGPGATGPDDPTTTSVLERIQAQKRSGIDVAGDDGDLTNDEPVKADGSTDAEDTRPDARPASGESEADPSSPEDAGTGASEGGPETTSATAAGGDGVAGDRDPASRLAGLDRQQFVDLVAQVWEAEGWMTTKMGATETVYDFVAIQEAPAKRYLVWADQRSPDEDVTRKTVKQCATALESSRGADRAVLVTTGTLTPTARSLAEERDVTVVTAGEFVDRVQAAGLHAAGATN